MLGLSRCSGVQLGPLAPAAPASAPPAAGGPPLAPPWLGAPPCPPLLAAPAPASLVLGAPASLVLGAPASLVLGAPASLVLGGVPLNSEPHDRRNSATKAVRWAGMAASLTQKTPQIDTPKAALKMTIQGSSTTGPIMLLSGSVGALRVPIPRPVGRRHFPARRESESRPAEGDPRA